MTKLITIALQHHGQNPLGWNFPWCAAFLNLVLEKAGVEHMDSLLARSFENIGRPTDTPQLGDIVVLWRVSVESQWGHCGLYITENKHSITLLGGNQDGTVKIKSYPKWQLLTIRNLDV